MNPICQKEAVFYGQGISPTSWSGGGFSPTTTIGLLTEPGVLTGSEDAVDPAGMSAGSGAAGSSPDLPAGAVAPLAALDFRAEAAG